ncbi:hypothetical protein VI817_000365 [Penicillium citrinum]|nr:hypothetical protein VI817_000365 [Penicillium citrinum]
MHCTLIISPSISHQRIPLHRQLSYATRFTKPQVLNQAHRTTTSPTIPTKSPAVLSHASLSLSPSHFSTKTPIMSDDAYMSFLDKANADLNAGLKTQQGTEPNRTETVDTTTQIPTPLQSVDSYYISDTDEPFEPVSLSWKGAKQGIWPSPDQLSGLISPNSDLSQDISTLTPSSFDPNNQYSSVFHAVRSAAVESDENGDQSAVEVKVYRVELSSTTLEYWLLALDVVEERIVGLRAKAVES